MSKRTLKKTTERFGIAAQISKMKKSGVFALMKKLTLYPRIHETLAWP
jgi:hypothetical protein